MLVRSFCKYGAAAPLTRGPGRYSALCKHPSADSYMLPNLLATVRVSGFSRLIGVQFRRGTTTAIFASDGTAGNITERCDSRLHASRRFGSRDAFSTGDAMSRSVGEFADRCAQSDRFSASATSAACVRMLSSFPRPPPNNVPLDLSAIVTTPRVSIGTAANVASIFVFHFIHAAAFARSTRQSPFVSVMAMACDARRANTRETRSHIWYVAQQHIASCGMRYGELKNTLSYFSLYTYSHQRNAQLNTVF